MDLKRLYYFVTVVNEGNISHAAKKLHMSQPPLSTQMRLLEKELSCTLFERGSRQIRLTEAGKLLYERALTMLELSNQTKKSCSITEMVRVERYALASSLLSAVLF